MNINTRRVKTCLQSFEFRKLFIEELNWAICNNPPVQIPLDEHSYCLTPVAQQGGMYIYLGECSNGEIPSYSTRRTIESRVTKLTHEHMIVFTDKKRTRAVWQWVKREQGQSAASREFPFYNGQTGDALLQKLAGIAFDINDMDEEGKASITRVTGKVAAAFDIEAKITKHFYDEFDKERKGFLEFLSGLKTLEDNEWYVSVMLNRLMFIYFIQKKNFLNNDRDYLNHKLAEMKKKGRNLYYAEYLIPLFFEGFAKEKDDRTSEIKELLGDIPYLNGGIFQKHKLEEENPGISIPDAAFDRIFTFFNRWDWNLDYRPISEGKEINPDVLGYIFEQYINRKQMGAYYTKEDITGYICKNTIIPALFDKLSNMNGIVPRTFPIKDIEPYIYQAVKQEEYLPTETDREYAARQERYHQIKHDFTTGKITNINDLITYNLDILKFAYDWARNINDGPTLRAFYFECLNKITILDPTVGSGAFLFAALNILEPLYEICIGKMPFVNCDKYPRIAQDFREELQKVAKHPNGKYFILKSIIINNLYGVDIMEEAVEICKLRLFLKLAAQVEDSNRMEPLPDIDFNIRAGNSLVGYANLDEIRGPGHLDLSGAMKAIEQKITEADRALQNFRDIQTKWGVSYAELAKAKNEAKTKLKEVEDTLNIDLAAFYGAHDMEKFLKSHKPFHWIVEFFGIMKNGGFNVIVGNPPYVEYRTVQPIYTLKNYETIACGDLYAFVLERSSRLLSASGRCSMIVPISITGTDGFSKLRELILFEYKINYFSTFAMRPSKLFDGADKHLCIFIGVKCSTDGNNSLFCTKYHRWLHEERESLFHRLTYEPVSRNMMYLKSIPKVGSPVEVSILQKLLAEKNTIGEYKNSYGQYNLYHTRKLRYFLQFVDIPPKIVEENGDARITSELKELKFNTKKDRDVALSSYCSTLFFWYYLLFSDCRNVNKREVEAFPLKLPAINPNTKEQLGQLSICLMKDLQNNSSMHQMNYKKYGLLDVQVFAPRLSKNIIDEIDQYLAQHYGFTEEELDFIINYDIKYRMGKDNGEEEE